LLPGATDQPVEEPDVGEHTHGPPNGSLVDTLKRRQRLDGNLDAIADRPVPHVNPRHVFDRLKVPGDFLQELGVLNESGPRCVSRR